METRWKGVRRRWFGGTGRRRSGAPGESGAFEGTRGPEVGAGSVPCGTAQHHLGNLARKTLTCVLDEEKREDEVDSTKHPSGGGALGYWRNHPQPRSRQNLNHIMFDFSRKSRNGHGSWTLMTGYGDGT